MNFLDRVGSYFHLDLKYYVKNAFYLISANVVSIVCGLLLSIAFARFLTQEIYGQYNYIFSILGILAIFSLPGMNIAITQAVARGHDRIFVEGTKIRLKWSFLGCIAVLLVGIYYYSCGEILLAKCLMISSLLFPSYFVFDTFNAFLSGKKLFDKIAECQSIITFLSVAITIIAIYYLRNLIWIVIIYLASISLLKVYFFIAATKKLENNDMDKDAVPFGKHMTLINLIMNIRAQYDKILIGVFIGFPDLAIYSIALVLANQVKAMGSIVGTLIFPKLSEMDKEEAYTAIKKRLPHLTLVFGIICGIGIMLIPYIIPLLYSQKYLDSVFYGQILFVSIAVGIPSMILISLLQSQKKTTELYKINISFSLFEIILLTLLVPTFGLLGAVFVKVLSRFYLTIISWVLSR